MGSPSPRSASHSEPAARRSPAISSRRPAASGSTTTVRMDFRVLSTLSAVGSIPACSIWRTRSTVASVVDPAANDMTSSVRTPSDSLDRHEPKHAMMNGALSKVPCSRSRMSFASASVYRHLVMSLGCPELSPCYSGILVVTPPRQGSSRTRWGFFMSGTVVASSAITGLLLGPALFRHRSFRLPFWCQQRLRPLLHILDSR